MPAVNIKGIGRVNFPDSMSQEQIIAAIEDDIIPQYKAEHPENTNFFAPLQQGLASTVQQVELGLGSLGRTDEETRAQAERNAAANKDANIKTTSWPDVKKAFGAGEHPPITLEEPGVTGVIPGLAEAAKFSKDAILQSFPAMGPSVAGAEAAAAAALSRGAGPKGALVAGGVGAVIAGVPQFIGSNIEAKIEAKTPGPLVTPGTVASAVGESALEATGVGYVLGKRIVSKIVGAPIKDVTEQNLLKAAKETVAGYALLPIKGAAVEGPVSVAQKVLERAQAGLPLTSPDAYEDYENEFAGGVAGGAPMRAASGIHDIRQAKKDLQEYKLQEAAKARAEVMKAGQEEEQRQQDIIDETDVQGRDMAQAEMANQDADITPPPPDYDPTRIPTDPQPTTPSSFDEWKRNTGSSDPAAYRRYVDALQPTGFDPTRIPTDPQPTTPSSFDEWKRNTGSSDPAAYRRYVDALQPTGFDPTRIPTDPQPTAAPFAQDAAQSTVINDAMLTDLGVRPSDKKVRNALKKVGDLSTQENIDAFKDILTDEANGKGNLSEARQQAAQLALERLDVIESKLRQQSEVMNESTNRPSPNTQTSGNTSDAVGSRTEPSVPLPTQRAPTTTQETQVTESGGVGVPSGDANTNNAVSGVREGSRQDTLAAQEEWASLSDVPFESLTPADQSRVVKAYEKGQSHEDDVSPMQAVAAQIRRRNSQLSKESKDESKEDVPPVEPSTTEEVNQAMGELLTPNQIARKPPIVVNDLSGLEGILPSDVIADVKAGGAKAFVHKGQDYYIASHIPKGNAKGTILHEKGGHLGLTKLIGASRIKALANRVNTWATSATSPMFGKEKAEITIAKEAIARANASGEPVGSDRYNQEVVAYFTEIAVNKYGIDPLETQPKEFDKVVGWLRDLWAGITDSLHKLRYAPETLKAKDIVDLVMGAARVEAMPDTKTTPTAEKTTADAPAQFSFEKQIPPSPADKAIAAQNGIRLPKRLTQEGVIAKLKARFNEITDNDLWGYLAQKNVGAGEAHALKHGTMYGTGERLNPLTGKEVGFVNLHRTLQADNIAMEAVNRGFPQLDKEGVAHVIPAASNMRALAGISTQIRADMKADGMSDALADTSIDYMLIADRHKELEAMGIDTGITNAEYLYGKKMQAKYAAQFRAWRDMHQKIREKTMQFLVDTNLFTPKKAREFLDRMEYVPFNREIPPGESTGAHLRGLLSAKKEHHIKGAGGLEIKDVMENIINNQVFLIKRGMANNTANLVADDMMRMNKDDNTQGGFEIPRDDKQGNNVEYLKQGQSQWFKVLNRNDAAIFHAAPVVNNIAVRIARTATGMLRKGITLMPTFTYNQLLQDPQRASFTAGTTSGVLGLAKTSLPEFRKNAFGGESPLAREGRAAGIVGAIDYQDTYDNWNKEVRGATRTGISKWFEKAERIARAQDLSNRLAVYKDVMDHGGTQNDATARAIMMYNYQNRGQGQHVSVLMALAPFINCRVQGDYRVLMALQGRLPGVTKAEAKKLVAKKILTFAAYTMMYTMATSGSDDRERADENTANNNFLLGGVKIPATPEFLPLKIAIEKSYRMMAGNINETKGKFAQAVSNAAKNLLVGPSDINPTAIKPLVENAFNHSTLTGKPLVGYTLQQKDVNMQFGDSTSEFSKAISDELQKLGGNTANMSPIKIDNLIKGWFGSVGRDALYTVDMLVGDKPAQKANRLPLVGGIFYDKEGNARVSDLYDLADESNRAWNTLADLEKHHPEKAEAYQKANLPLLRVHDSLKDMTSLLNEMREAKKAAVRENPATARAEISRLDAMANKILEKELPAIRKELGK